MIRLQLRVGDDPTPRDFADEEILIGRSSTNHLVIPDLRASRHHARIESAGAGVRLVDLTSGNGTRWNGRRIETAVLKAGDVLDIGLARLHVLRLETIDATTAVPPAASPRRGRLSAV